MSVALYFDVHVRRAVTEGLRLREVDVLTAQEDDAATMDDPVLLDRAMALGRQSLPRMKTSYVKPTDARRPAKLLLALFTRTNSM